MNQNLSTPIKTLLTAVLAACSLHAEYITLITTGGYSDPVEVEEGQIAEVVSFPRAGHLGSFVRVERGEIHATFEPSKVHWEPIIVAGPAIIKIHGAGGNNATVCTLKITPDTDIYPPDKTVVIPADTNGANIILEQSTDFVNWTPADPGVFTNLTGHLFFRIRAERLPE